MTSNLLLAAVCGLLGGIGIAFLREYVDDTISSPLDAATYLRVPFLGIVPAVPPNVDSATYTHDMPRSTVAEGARAVRTMLELNPHGAAPKRLLVTSSVASEGKTGTTIRLGIAFASVGKRALLIDADLRRPRLHTAFGLSRGPGLSDVLGGKGNWREFVRRTDVPGLTLLSVGSACDRPHEVLAGGAMGALLDELGEHFDAILIDTPPCAVLADAIVLSKQVDGVLLVVRAHAVSRVVIAQTIDRLRQVDANIVGAVLNAVDVTNQGYPYRYYYGYKTNYYTYGSDEQATADPSSKKNASAG